MTILAEIERSTSHRFTSTPTSGGRTVVRVALAGCGSVGSAVIRELVARKESLEAHALSAEYRLNCEE